MNKSKIDIANVFPNFDQPGISFLVIKSMSKKCMVSEFPLSHCLSVYASTSSGILCAFCLVAFQFPVGTEAPLCATVHFYIDFSLEPGSFPIQKEDYKNQIV